MYKRLIATSVSAIISCGAADAGISERPRFTNHDALNITRLYDVQTPDDDNMHPFLYSPDSKSLFIITGSGDAEGKTYRFKLLKYDVADLVEFVNSDRLPQPDPVTLFETTYDQSYIAWPPLNYGGIQNLQFSGDNKTIFFSAADRNAVFQLYSVDIASRQIVQLSDSATNVLEYVVSPEQNAAIIAPTYFFPRDTHCAETGYSVGQKAMFNAYCFNGLSMADHITSKVPSTLFSKLQRISLTPGAPALDIAKPVSFKKDLRQAVLSPDGRFAVVRLQDKDAPAALDKYFRESAMLKKVLGDGSNFDANISLLPVWFSYYALLDIESGRLHKIERLIDRDESVAGIVRWIDNQRVEIANVELLGEKFDGVMGEEDPTLVTIDASGEQPKVQYVRAGLSLPGAAASSSMVNAVGNASKSVPEGRCLRGPTRQAILTMLADGVPHCYADSPNMKVRVTKAERFDSPPTLHTNDLRTGKSKPIKVLNPQYGNIAMAGLEYLQWKDEKGVEWHGVLILPATSNKKYRYPLVIYPEGFDINQFPISGPFFEGSPFTAQALAGKGITVLQMTRLSPVSLENSVENGNSIIARGIDSAVENLVRRELVDEQKVGIVGFSAMGRFTLSYTTFPTFVPKAVVISDAASPSPMGYAWMFGTPTNMGMLTYERMTCGGNPWGENQTNWIQRNPYYNLDKIRSPILIDEYASYTDWYDIYAGLKRLGKPVDLYLYTEGNHPPARADVNLMATDVIVDWFDFWLNEREDAAPEKEDRYASWRKLRADLAGLPVPAEPAMRLSQMDCPSK